MPDRHVQGGQPQGRRHVSIHRIAHHGAGMQIEDDGQVQPAFSGAVFACHMEFV